MRNYAQEGWTSQLQGRIITGHFLLSTTFAPVSSTTRITMAVRNPLVQAPRQTHLHLLRVTLHPLITLDDDAAGHILTDFHTIDGYTVSDNAGGSAIAPVNLARTGLTTACEGRVSTGSTNITGGTRATQEQSLAAANVAQAAAAGTDAAKVAFSIWEARFAPVLLKGDQGFLIEYACTLTSPQAAQVFAAVEWLETVKQ